MRTSPLRLVGLGVATSVAALIVAIGAAWLASGRVQWQAVAIMLLSLAALVFVLQMSQRRSLTTGAGTAQQVYMESVAREASGHRTPEHGQPRLELGWFLAALPPILTLLAVLVVG